MKFIFRNKTFNIGGFSPEDHIYKTIEQRKVFYELDLLEYIRAILGKQHDSVCIDVGANIGNHSIYFGNFVADSVISVEPNDLVLPILRENLQNNVDNYKLFECGLGATATFGKIHMPENSSSNIGMAKIEVLNENVGDCFLVRSLDDVFEEWAKEKSFKGGVSLIKIDVEGMELDVLKGSNAVLNKYKPHVFVEAATEKHFSELNIHLKNLGYTALSKWAATPVYHFAFSPPLLLRAKIIMYKLICKLKARYWRLFPS